jgi:hypothetical protein
MKKIRETVDNKSKDRFTKLKKYMLCTMHRYLMSNTTRIFFLKYYLLENHQNIFIFLFFISTN